MRIMYSPLLATVASPRFFREGRTASAVGRGRTFEQTVTFHHRFMARLSPPDCANTVSHFTRRLQHSCVRVALELAARPF
ncbi:hypothetical protein [Paraburkholderia phenoliruptrix]|uniref:hypothetical protein n=1 Tax=Paraburkholderia phenoliruptrix TaxID=252970 RepID=UPI001C6EAE5E|nr:hypothetical protein [Paraburkholderia phenoliruptrix]MBW9106585.1 hypothetical protein [Paraburkholderia phenoliruptrix]